MEVLDRMPEQRHDKKVGEFLVENGIITTDQLNEALILQKDNKERLIGEILVTLGILSKEDMIMAFEMYLMVTDLPIAHVDEWLDQDEVDMIMERIKERGANNK
jgi:signal-transduction protein with cAMP-binding, CBS, and nucleotidyltransferase domain